MPNSRNSRCCCDGDCPVETIQSGDDWVDGWNPQPTSATISNPVSYTDTGRSEWVVTVCINSTSGLDNLRIQVGRGFVEGAGNDTIRLQNGGNCSAHLLGLPFCVRFIECGEPGDYTNPPTRTTSVELIRGTEVIGQSCIEAEVEEEDHQLEIGITPGGPIEFFKIEVQDTANQNPDCPPCVCSQSDRQPCDGGPITVITNTYTVISGAGVSMYESSFVGENRFSSGGTFYTMVGSDYYRKITVNSSPMNGTYPWTLVDSEPTNPETFAEWLERIKSGDFCPEDLTRFSFDPPRTSNRPTVTYEQRQDHGTLFGGVGSPPPDMPAPDLHPNDDFSDSTPDEITRRYIAGAVAPGPVSPYSNWSYEYLGYQFVGYGGIWARQILSNNNFDICQLPTERHWRYTFPASETVNEIVDFPAGSQVGDPQVVISTETNRFSPDQEWDFKIVYDYIRV